MSEHPKVEDWISRQRVKRIAREAVSWVVHSSIGCWGVEEMLDSIVEDGGVVTPEMEAEDYDLLTVVLDHMPQRELDSRLDDEYEMIRESEVEERREARRKAEREAEARRRELNVRTNRLKEIERLIACSVATIENHQARILRLRAEHTLLSKEEIQK